MRDATAQKKTRCVESDVLIYSADFWSWLLAFWYMLEIQSNSNSDTSSTSGGCCVLFLHQSLFAA